MAKPDKITYWPPRADGETFYARVPYVLEGVWAVDDTGEVLFPPGTLVVVGGYLKRGEEHSWDPKDVPGTYRIGSVGYKPDMRTLKQLVVAALD